MDINIERIFSLVSNRRRLQTIIKKANYSAIL